MLYTDLKTGAEYEQPANIVILSAFVFSNTHMLLHSGIGQPYDHKTGKGLVGKNYCYQFEAPAAAFFPTKELNPYMGAPGGALPDRRFQRRQFRPFRAGLFRRRLFQSAAAAAVRRSTGAPCRAGTPAWGSQWKRETVKWYYHATHFNTQGSVYAHRDNYMDMDPTYTGCAGTAAAAPDL